MDYPDEFAAYFNSLKRQAEGRMLARHGSPVKCEKIVRAKLAQVMDVLDGEETEVVFLVAGSIVANIVAGYWSKP